VRHPPADLETEHLAAALAEGWRLAVDELAYLPVGGGSHHWVARAGGGGRHFVTVDVLEDKDWLGTTHDEVLAGLTAALETAETLRTTAGLGFVVAPLGAHDGAVVHRISPRHALAVYPFHDGHSFPFGPYADPGQRDRALDLLVALHRATPIVGDRAPRHLLGFGGRDELERFLADPGRPWDAGPFGEPARRLFASHRHDVTALVARFDLLAARTAQARSDTVVTHGEPHPANLLEAAGALLLVDWDTVGLAPPERDLALVLGEGGAGRERYEAMTGHEVHLDVITLYRLRWYLDDLGSAVRLFRHPHGRDADTERWWDALAPRVGGLSGWLERSDGLV
jgi:spectinomycin phosphotransferase